MWGQVAPEPHPQLGVEEATEGLGKERRVYRPPAPTCWPQEAAAT